MVNELLYLFATFGNKQTQKLHDAFLGVFLDKEESPSGSKYQFYSKLFGLFIGWPLSLFGLLIFGVGWLVGYSVLVLAIFSAIGSVLFSLVTVFDDNIRQSLPNFWLGLYPLLWLGILLGWLNNNYVCLYACLAGIMGYGLYFWIPVF